MVSRLAQSAHQAGGPADRRLDGRFDHLPGSHDCHFRAGPCHTGVKHFPGDNSTDPLGQHNDDVPIFRALALVDREGVDCLDVFEAGDGELNGLPVGIKDAERRHPGLATRHHHAHVAVAKP